MVRLFLKVSKEQPKRMTRRSTNIMTKKRRKRKRKLKLKKVRL